MAEIRRLDPHDPLPDGPGKHLVVLRRFEEDDPGRRLVEIILSSSRPGGVERTRPMRPKRLWRARRLRNRNPSWSPKRRNWRRKR